MNNVQKNRRFGSKGRPLVNNDNYDNGDCGDDDDDLDYKGDVTVMCMKVVSH